MAINLALARMNGVSHERHFGRQLREVLGRASKKVELACECVFDTQQSLSNLTLCEKLPSRAHVGLWMETLCPIKDAIGRIKGIGFLVVEIEDPWAAANPRLSHGQSLSSVGSARMPGTFAEGDPGSSQSLVFYRRWVLRNGEDLRDGTRLLK